MPTRLTVAVHDAILLDHVIVDGASLTINVAVSAASPPAPPAPPAPPPPPPPTSPLPPLLPPGTGPHGRDINATNTGVPAGTKLTPRTPDMVVTTAGAVIEKFEFVGGTIFIAADNVIIRKCKIRDLKNENGIKIDGSQFKGTVVEDCEIYGGALTNGITGSQYTARRVHVHHSRGDGFRVGSQGKCLFENCFAHDLGLAEGSHADGIQVYASDMTKAINSVVRGCKFQAKNAALFHWNDNECHDSWLEAKNFSVQGERGKWTGNTFAGSPQYGDMRFDNAEVWQNNTDEQGRQLGKNGKPL